MRFLKSIFHKNTNGSASEKEQVQRPIILRIGVAAALALIITLFFPRGKSFEFADLKEGQVYIGDEIIAPFSFPVLKTAEEYQRDVAAAHKSVRPVFEWNDNIAAERLEQLQLFLDRMDLLLKGKTSAPERVKELFDSYKVPYSDEDVLLLLNGFTVPDGTGRSGEGRRVAAFKQIAAQGLKLVRERYTIGIIDVTKAELQGYEEISVRRNEREYVESVNYFPDRAQAQNALLQALRGNDLTERQVKVAFNIAAAFLTPNMIFDKKETEARIADRVAKVPLAKDQVLAGESIIAGHQRLTKQHLEKLHSLAVAKAERLEATGAAAVLAPTAGKFLMMFALLILLLFYLYQDHRDVFFNDRKLALIGLSFLLIALISHLVFRLSLSPLIIPVTAFSMIVTIFMDARIGLLTTLIASLMIGAMRGNEFSVVFISFLAGTAAVQTVRKVRNRNWIIHSGAWISLVYLIAVVIISLVAYTPFPKALGQAGIGVLNGFLSPGLAYLLIVILESLFDMTTDMTLLELSDFNHPLLRQLLLEAPGTYHHSYLTGLLAESAAEAVNGNALLARVGAYYHDIGKLEKPEYFIENQIRGRNPQEKLTPTMSALILANHVRKGVEIAREHGLPKELEAFIREHHGTSLMSYFYQKAVELGGDSVSPNEFRYPGPRPRTRETAVVMLADSVEAASRTLKDPPPSRIRNLIEQIIDERFKGGELDEAPLTLSDLSKIASAFHKVLLGRFHGRIDYPTTVNGNESA